MPSTVWQIYLQSKKKNDNFWTEWVSRPPAAIVVWLLRPTPVTPNQVTFLSVATFAAAAACLVAWQTHWGLITAALLGQLSYILDCADGQLARLKSMSSPVGALLDFLMDEVKAFLLIGGATVRLWLTTGKPWWPLVGVGGLVAAATGIALTAFMRRDEYLAATGTRKTYSNVDGSFTKGAAKSRSPIGLALALVEGLGRLVLHYPTYFLFIAIFDRLDIFAYAYLGAHALYLGKASLTVLVKLGRFARPPAPAPVGEAGAAAAPTVEAASAASEIPTP